MKYNKLVRDLIPNAIKADGKDCDIEIAEKEDMGGLLEAKLMEEVNEYIQDKNLEELADVMEVLFGLAHNLGYSEEDLLNKRNEKVKARGGFKEGIILKSVKASTELKDRLITATIENKDKLVYVNLNEKNQYRGWTYDFNLLLPDGKQMHLDLLKEDDLFLLFVLASSWSKTGAWENAAFFTTYLKYSGKYKREQWLDKEFIKEELLQRENNANYIVSSTKGIIPRKKVSFRKDYYSSVEIIARNWEKIKESLTKAENESDYLTFINYISSIDGLGAGTNKMRIKILLILRELRCQKAYNNIPGEFCCIPDNRVKDALKVLGIQIPTINSMDNILKASKVIYDNFGDLYDIPLFAYQDFLESGDL